MRTTRHDGGMDATLGAVETAGCAVDGWWAEKSGRGWLGQRWTLRPLRHANHVHLDSSWTRNESVRRGERRESLRPHTPVALYSRRTSSRFVGRPFVFSRSKASGGACHDDRGLESDRRGRAGGLDPSRTGDPLTQTRRRRTVVSCGWTGAHSTVSWCVGSRLVRFARGTVPVCPTRRTRFRLLPSEARPCQFDLRFGRGRYHVGVVAQFPRRFLRVHSTTRHPDRHVCGSRSSEHPHSHVRPDRRKPRGKRPPEDLRPRTGRDHVTAGIRFARTGEGAEPSSYPLRVPLAWLSLSIGRGSLFSGPATPVDVPIETETKGNEPTNVSIRARAARPHTQGRDMPTPAYARCASTTAKGVREKRWRKGGWTKDARRSEGGRKRARAV